MTDSKNTTDTGETLPGVDVSDWPETADVTHDVPTGSSPAASTTSSNGSASSSCPHSPCSSTRSAPAWGWPHVDAIVTTLNALGILAGVLIGVSAIKQRIDLAA